jgi:methionyl aminopeptidase
LNLIQLKSPDEIEALYRANQVVAEALLAMAEAAGPGATTALMDEIGRRILEKHRAKSAFLNYPHHAGGRPFPATVCTSVNDVIIHGIPSEKTVLKEGDILSLDFGAILNGWVGDSALTVPIGPVGEEAKRLMDATRESLHAGIEKARDGNRVGDISWAVQELAESRGYGVVTEFIGHGIGRKMHEPPPVPNRGRPNMGERLRIGMVLAIEPMINAGTPGVITASDGWTARTADRKLSAHFEHSVAITPKGPRILSARPEGARF